MKPTAVWAAHVGTDAASQPAVATSLPKLKRMLDSVVVTNWNDVMPNNPEGQVDIEYRLAADGSLEYLRLWACSRRGFCDLVCQYSMFWKWSNTETVSFGSGYNSKPLAGGLDYILQHQRHFCSIAEPRQIVLQVRSPSPEQRDEARKELSAALAA